MTNEDTLQSVEILSQLALGRPQQEAALIQIEPSWACTQRVRIRNSVNAISDLDIGNCFCTLWHKPVTNTKGEGVPWMISKMPAEDTLPCQGNLRFCTISQMNRILAAHNTRATMHPERGSIWQYHCEYCSLWREAYPVHTLHRQDAQQQGAFICTECRAAVCSKCLYESVCEQMFEEPHLAAFLQATKVVEITNTGGLKLHYARATSAVPFFSTIRMSPLTYSTWGYYFVYDPTEDLHWELNELREQGHLWPFGPRTLEEDN